MDVYDEVDRRENNQSEICLNIIFIGLYVDMIPDESLQRASGGTTFISKTPKTWFLLLFFFF